MQVEQLDMQHLRPYWRNPRQNHAAIEPVRRSIEQYGYNQPIVVDEEGTIIVGHTRYQALLQLGWEQAPVVVSNMSSEEAKAYRIADNKTHEFSAWDQDALVAELRELDREAMQPFFIEDVSALLEDSVGGNYQPPSDEQIGRQQERQDTQYTERSEGNQVDMVELACPECGETIYVSRADVLRRTE